MPLVMSGRQAKDAVEFFFLVLCISETDCHEKTKRKLFADINPSLPLTASEPSKDRLHQYKKETP